MALARTSTMKTAIIARTMMGNDYKGNDEMVGPITMALERKER